MAAVALVVGFTLLSCEGPAGPAGPQGPTGSPNVQTVLSAYLSVGQTVSGFTSVVVEFDASVVDEYDALDTTTGAYSVPADGDYHLCAGIDWQSTFDEGAATDYEIRVNGGQVLNVDTTVGTASSREYQSVACILRQSQ